MGALAFVGKINFMSAQVLQLCPSCKEKFECRKDNIQLCQCAGIVLTAQQKEWVQAQFDNCLCATCLTKISKGEKPGATNLAQHENKASG
jgi:hypothetical protein